MTNAEKMVEILHDVFGIEEVSMHEVQDCFHACAFAQC